MSALELTEFLQARIAEDEANLPDGFDCWYPPERYAAECEAKRRIVELHPMRTVTYGPGWNGKPDEYECSTCTTGHGNTGCEDEPFPCPTLRALALPYADHPDFCEEWRP